MISLGSSRDSTQIWKPSLLNRPASERVPFLDFVLHDEELGDPVTTDPWQTPGFLHSTPGQHRKQTREELGTGTAFPWQLETRLGQRLHVPCLLPSHEPHTGRTWSGSFGHRLEILGLVANFSLTQHASACSLLIKASPLRPDVTGTSEVPQE